MEPVRKLPVGSRIRVTRICHAHQHQQLWQRTPFNILLRSSSDIAYVKGTFAIQHPHMGISVLFC